MNFFPIILTIHLLITIALIGLILLQRSEGGGLGTGGSSSSLMTARGKGDLLTRTTAIMAALFLGLSLVLAIMTNHNAGGPLPFSAPSRAPAPSSTPNIPAGPTAPLAH